MIASGTNALASSIVLVCRRRDPTAAAVTRADFLRALRPRCLPHSRKSAALASADQHPASGHRPRYRRLYALRPGAQH